MKTFQIARKPSIFKLFTLVFMLVINSILPAKADNYPPGDVSCSLTSKGVYFSVSISFSGNTSLNSLSYEWDYSLLLTGRTPENVANYGSRSIFTRTDSNGLEMPYESLLDLAKNDSNATVLVFANTVYTVSNSVITNKNGKGCYVELPVVLKNKIEKAQQNSNTNSTSASDASNNQGADSSVANTDIARALRDLPNAAIEAEDVDLLTAVALDEQARIAAVNTQVQTLIAAVKAQITSISNLVIKIQKKVKA